jgi:hypothetical protein
MGDDKLIFDKWANEVNQRVQVWRRPNGDIEIIFVDSTTGVSTAGLSLTAYRADDLALALTRST